MRGWCINGDSVLSWSMSSTEIHASANTNYARLLTILGRGVLALVVIALLYSAWIVYLVGQPLFGMLLLIVAMVFGVVFSSRRFYSLRFIVPGMVTMVLFVVFPIIYTIYLGFTNYGSFNLLNYDRAQQVVLSSQIVDKASSRPFSVLADKQEYRIYIADKSASGGYLTQPVALNNAIVDAGVSITLHAQQQTAEPEQVLSRRDVIQLRKALALLTIELPNGEVLKSAGLRAFAAIKPEYVLQADESIVNQLNGKQYWPDHDVGFYVDADGKQLAPGWRTHIGWGNFERIINFAGIRGPMWSIFLWTIGFAVGSVVFCFAVGVALAVVLQWPHLRFRGVYRVMLILPYAVPAFISILVFKGLFNQNFGEINLILEAIFGIRPDWNTDADLARTMLLIVNTWLGYPYMMLLAMGFLQAVPADQKKAAYIEGASALRVFFTITLPQIMPPFIPLLLAAFAFNFNNIVLILLLTRGLPDIPGTLIPAGETDILGSFTYRIAFMDSGTQFGLAGAITLIIFALVAIMAYASFIAMRKNQGKAA